MKRLNLKSFVKHLSMAALGTLLTAGIVIAPQLSVRADDAVTTDAVYRSEDKSLTISGTIVNDPYLKYGIVLEDTILKDTNDKKAVEHIIIDSNATFPVNAYGLFEGFDNVTSISIQSDSDKTASMTNMAYMFNGLKKLERIELTGINTSNVTNMAGMFLNCQSLESLDLSCFTVSQIKDSGTGQNATNNMMSMFENCFKLEKIIVNPNTWSIDSSVVGTYMFTGDTSLVGGNGTLYNSAYVTASYACVDTPKTPGYLSTSSSLTPYAQLMTDGSNFVLSISIKNESQDTKIYTVYYDNKEIRTDSLMHNETANFNISCAAKEMADAKYLKITDGGTEVFNKKISVADYLRRICQIYNTDNVYYKLAGSMLRYGAAAQKYFNYNTDKLANKGIDGYNTFDFDPAFGDEYSEQTTSINAATIQKESALKDFTYSGISLSLDGEINFMMAFKLPSEAGITSWENYTNKDAVETAIKKYISTGFQDKTTFRLDGTGKYLLAVTPVNVKNIDSVIYTSAGFGNDISAVTYLYRNYKRSTSTDDLKNVCKSLYAFHQLAKGFN